MIIPTEKRDNSLVGIDIFNTCDELLFSISIPSMIELALQVASGLMILFEREAKRIVRKKIQSEL